MAAATFFLELVFWASVVYYTYLVDRLNIFNLRQYRIATNKKGERQEFSSEDWSKALNHVFENNFISRPFFLFVSFSALEACLKGLGKSTADDALPSLATFGLQIFGCMLVDDTLFYW